VALEYPWSVPHLLLEARTYRLRDPFSGSGDISLLASCLKEHIDYKHSTDPERNQNLSIQDALRISTRTDGDLLLDFRTALAKRHAAHLRLLQTQMSRTKKFNALSCRSICVAVSKHSSSL